jgi:exodeoxyribonuclease V beta subunit
MRLWIDGAEPAPLQVWMLQVDEENQTTRPPGFIRSDAALGYAARACAEYIAGLLNLAGEGRATIGDRALEPGDIALLVRTHREGDLVQRALRVCGISSVSLSEGSVFATEDAQEVATLLEALADLHDEGRMRAALTTCLLGRTASELERLATDELAWEALLARFQSYAERWRNQGVMVAMQELLAAERVPARLLGRPDGERRLTNLLQLLELLQVASGEHPGPDGLLRWLADQRAGDERDEARQLRLESDQGLVKVVTLHKSKGLEYPLVFIPFPWSYFKQRKPYPPAFFHSPEDKQACLDLGSEEEARHRVLERTEQLAERLRLFYVGVTRAARLCVLCWGKVHRSQDAALAYLLHRDPQSEIPASRMQEMTEKEIRDDLDALARRAPGAVEIRDLPLTIGERWMGIDFERDRLAPKAFDSVIDASWRVASYSALVRGDDSERPDYDPRTDPLRRNPEPLDRSSSDPLFELPAGTHVGHFLHEVLERMDFQTARGETLTKVVRELLDRYGGIDPNRASAINRDDDWAPVVEELVTNVLDTWLDPAGSLRLRDVAAVDRIPELEFHFPVAGLDSSALSEVLALSADHAGSAEGLELGPMRGLMRGFIDLVFRRDGRYFVVDYKSNRLGDGSGGGLTAYERDGLRHAIRRHRYNLQYLIYTLAVHRYLGWRLPGYDYQTHFGGVYYLFLRGMRPQLGPGCGIWYDRPSFELIAALDRLFGGDARAP